MKNLLVLLSALILIAFAVPASAQTQYTYPAKSPVLSITFPEGWDVKLDQEDMAGVSAVSDDEEIEMYLWPLDEEDVAKDPEAAIKEAAQDAGKDIAEWVSGATFKEPVSYEANGMSFVGIEGAGKSIEDKSDVTVSLAFFSPDNKTVFALLFYGSPEAEKKHAAALDSISKSIKKAGK